MRAGKRKTKFPKYLDADKKREEEERKQAEIERVRNEGEGNSGSELGEVDADIASSSGPDVGVRRVVRKMTPLKIDHGQVHEDTDPEVAHPVGRPVFLVPKVATRVEVRTGDPISTIGAAQAPDPSSSQWQILQKRMDELERSQAEFRARRQKIEQRGLDGTQSSSPDKNEVTARLAAVEQRKKDLEAKKVSLAGTIDLSSSISPHAGQPRKPAKPAKSVTSLVAARGDLGVPLSKGSQRIATTGRPLVVRLEDIKDKEDKTSALYHAFDDLDDI